MKKNRKNPRNKSPYIVGWPLVKNQWGPDPSASEAAARYQRLVPLPQAPQGPLARICAICAKPARAALHTWCGDPDVPAVWSPYCGTKCLRELLSLYTRSPERMNNVNNVNNVESVLDYSPIYLSGALESIEIPIFEEYLNNGITTWEGVKCKAVTNDPNRAKTAVTPPPPPGKSAICPGKPS